VQRIAVDLLGLCKTCAGRTARRKTRIQTNL
jgi:hypothetical protein